MAIIPPDFSKQTILSQHQNTKVCEHQGRDISYVEMLQQAWHLSLQLPEKAYAMNLCQNRYHFTVVYLAVILRQQINLLPPNRAEKTLANLLAQYPDSYCLTDSSPPQANDNYLSVEALISDNPATQNQMLEIDNKQLVSISFTSGTTGTPIAVKKTWGEFERCAQLATTQLGLDTIQHCLISTVPPQHMYGLETSVFWPMFSMLYSNSKQPFFPDDINTLIADADSPCILITTPTHLKACVQARVSWKNIHCIISSTAPLSASLAQQIEQQMRAPVFEIFGSTETLSFASRRSTHNQYWRPYSGIQFEGPAHQLEIKGGHLSQPIPLDDHLHIKDNGEFSVVGRSTDIIKVAGKRASITALNHIINGIKGVEDAIFYPTGHGRLGALVVSNLPKQYIFEQLKKHIDSVFLPRPLHLVTGLPRNEVSKIIKSSLDKLINELDRA